MRNNKIIWFLLVITFLLTSCSVFSPVKTEPTNTYVLSSTPVVSIKKSKRSATLLVNYPQTTAMYNTTQMIYSTQPFKIAYFAKNQWAETPSQMLLPLIAKTIQNTHYFRQVITPGVLGQYDYVLNTQLLKMQQVFFDHSSRVEIVLRAQLINAKNSRIVATKDFTVEKEAFPSPYGGVVAMNQAVSALLSQLTVFLLK
jgi:cholesterol transport system auxiliary component